ATHKGLVSARSTGTMGSPVGGGTLPTRIMIEGGIRHMTDPTASDPTPAPGSEPVYAPPPATAPTPPAPAAAGGATAMVVADVPNRVIAYIIDIICLAIIGIGVAIVLGAIGLSAVAVGTASTSINWFGAIVQTVVALAISAA